MGAGDRVFPTGVAAAGVLSVLRTGVVGVRTAT